jgi:hypothetical protein
MKQSLLTIWPAFFAYADNYLIDVKFGVTSTQT